MVDLYRLIKQSQVSVDNVRDTASATTIFVKDMYLGSSKNDKSDKNNIDNTNRSSGNNKGSAIRK